MAGLLSELCEILILIVAGDLGFSQVRGIAIDGDVGTFCSENRKFCEIGEDQDKGRRVIKGDLVAELTLDYGDGIQCVGTIIAVNIQFTLIEALERAFEQESLPFLSTRDNNQSEQYISEDLFHSVLFLNFCKFQVVSGIFSIGGILADSLAQSFAGVRGVTHTSIENSLQVFCGCIGVLDIFQRGVS